MTDAQDYMFQRLDMMEKRQKEINDLLAEGNLSSQKIVDLSKELSTYDEPVSLYVEYKKMVSDKEAAEALSKDQDPDMKMMGESEVERLTPLIDEKLEQLQKALLPKMQMMTITSSWKSKEQSEEKKHVCLQLTFSVCIPNTLRVRDGRFKSWMNL